MTNATTVRYQQVGQLSTSELLIHGAKNHDRLANAADNPTPLGAWLRGLIARMDQLGIAKNPSKFV
jgi:hypothetical protein